MVLTMILHPPEYRLAMLLHHGQVASWAAAAAAVAGVCAAVYFHYGTARKCHGWLWMV